MSDLLCNFKGCAPTTIRALNYSVPALFEDVHVEFFISYRFALALVVGAIKSRAFEHSLLDWV